MKVQFCVINFFDIRMVKDLVRRIHPLEKQMNISANRREFGDDYDAMQWIDESAAQELMAERDELIGVLVQAGVQTGYYDTKLDCRSLSPGCVLCAEGQWSCLFINNKCNAACFYCPAPQDEISEPATNHFTFPKVEEYISYLEKFKFKGCSLSGGEPFLTFEKTLHYIKEIKNHFGKEMYVWMYTNGILSTVEKLTTLAAAGLDEIRFDIGATGFKTDKVREAVGIIPRVTVEIPAVPGELEKLKKASVELAAAGVNHLNLHQLRCTPYNREKLIKKGLVFMHGPRVLVAGSELTALKLIQYLKEENINLPVNYCSFVFKNSHQNKASRKRGQESFMGKTEESTHAGYIRSLYVQAAPEKLTLLNSFFAENDMDPALWQYNPGASRMPFNSSLLPLLNKWEVNVLLSYLSTVLLPTVSYRNPFRELYSRQGKKVIIEKRCVLKDFLVHPDEYAFVSDFNNINNEWEFCEKMHLLLRGAPQDRASKWLLIKELECMKKGLQEYY